MTRKNLVSGTDRQLTAAVVLVGALAVSLPAQKLDLGLEGTQSAPPSDPVTVEVVTSVDSSTAAVSLTLRMADNVHVYAAESLFFGVDLTTLEGVDSPAVSLPEAADYRNFDGTTARVYHDGQTVQLTFPITGSSWHISGAIRYQACNEKLCFIPTKKSFALGSDDGAQKAEAVEGSPGRAEGAWTDLVSAFRVAGSVGGYQNADRFSAFLSDPGSVAGSGTLVGKSIWLIVLIVLVGGLLLNLTPCVLPMLPITLAVIGAGAQARSRLQGALVGGVYGAGMAIAYGVAGAVVIVTGTTFGSLNASPVFNLAIAGLFVVLSLAMFDIIHIDFTKFRGTAGQPAGKKRGALAVLGMGMVAALLAGACVAPVVISVVVYATAAYAQGSVVALLLPMLLGVGMALPWPLAAAGLSFLPRPGGWMVWVRNAFGVVILGLALYYGYTGVQILRSASPASQEAVTPTDSDAPELLWRTSLTEGLEEALATDKPVFIDFWATWCKNCHAMDATTLRDPQVRALLVGYVLVKYQAEDPGASPAREVLTHFGVVGLPTYVVLTADRAP